VPGARLKEAGMRRRAFLRGLGAAGGAALASGVARLGAAAHARPTDRLRAAGLSVVAKVVVGDGAAAAEVEVPLGAGSAARKSIPGGTITLQASPVAGEPDAVDVTATLGSRGRALSVAVELRLDVARWSRDVYLVLPGACYAGNRFESRRAGYPALLTEPADIGPNVPVIVTDVPRLELHPGPSRVDARAADLATPGLGVLWPESRLGLVALVDPTTPLGGVGLSVEENEERSAAAICVRAPLARDLAWSGEAAGARGRGATASLRDGERVTLRARLHLFDCADPPALFARLFTLRKELTGRTAAVHELPFSAAFAAHEERVNRRFVETHGFYAVGARDSAYSTWQTGWSGGLAGTLPLLAAGAARSRERAWRTTAFLLDGGQAPSGFFHAVSDGKTWSDDGFSAPWPRRGAPGPFRHAHRWHLVRRSGDTLLALCKQLALLERRPEPTGNERLVATLGQAARRTADAFVRLWDRYHQLGQFVDVESGELVVGGSTSAGIVPAALALAAARFKREGYLRVAQAAGESFYTRYVAAGLACGGPGDALQCPDSESAAALVESFVTLWEATGDRVWIARAEAAAHLLASWVISYEPFAAGSGRSGDLRATGGVLTNAQSGRGAPGYVLASGDALFRLYRATGDRLLLELLRDSAHGLAQYLPALERPATQAGHDEEPWSRTDPRGWLGRSPSVVPTPGLIDAIALLTYTEVPGLYAQIDRGLVFAFDHVEARLKERLGGKLVVSLSNPTSAEAVVRLYAESSTEAATPLPPGAVAGAPTVVVPAGATVDALVPPPAVTARR
jgi:hypothetical protein